MLTNTTARIIFLASHGGLSWINVALGDQAHTADEGETRFLAGERWRQRWQTYLLK
jgi:hypothetical protein